MFVSRLPCKQVNLLNANNWRSFIVRPLLFEQCTIVLKVESQGKCSGYVIGEDERGSQLSPLPCFSEFLGTACLAASLHWLSVGRAGGGQMGAEESETARFLLFLCLKARVSAD